MNLVLSEIYFFGGSDMLSCPAFGQGFLQCYGANVLAHAAIALFAGLMVFALGRSMRWFVIPLMFLIVKEIVIDIPANPWVVLVWLDSAADILTYVLSAAFVLWALMVGAKAGGAP